MDPLHLVCDQNKSVTVSSNVGTLTHCWILYNKSESLSLTLYISPGANMFVRRHAHDSLQNLC